MLSHPGGGSTSLRPCGRRPPDEGVEGFHRLVERQAVALEAK